MHFYKRTEFEIAYKRFAETVEILLPSHVTQEFINDLQWLSYIRAAAKARFTPQDEIDISGCGQKVKEIISEHLKAKGVSLYIKPVTLFGKDFKEFISKIDTDKGRAISMEKLIRHTISIKINDNPVYYTSLLEKLKKILEDTEENWLERKNRLKEFIERDIKTGEEDAAKKYGISKEEFAIFEAVKAQLSKTNEFAVSEKDTELLKKITSDIDRTIKDSYVIDWTTNITKTQNIERSVKDMLILGYYNKFKMEGINRLVPQVINIAKVHYGSI